MTETLPAPLVPAGVVLRDFPYMPLDVVRLRDSDLATKATPEAFRCAVMLWCVSWHQVPAGSLPDDDVSLASFAGFGKVVREWRKHRDGALHGWIKCSDGRLYHPVVSEKAIEALHARHMQAYRTECARIKKHAQRTKVDADYPTFEEWVNHYESTGSAKWSRPAAAPSGDERPGDVPGTNDHCGDLSRSKGREGKGREGISISGTTHSSANTKDHERGLRIVDALRGHGYKVDSGHPAVVRLVVIAATDAEIAEAGAASKKGWLPQKSIAWVLARIEGKRADGTAAGQQGDGGAAVDPAIAARAEADRKRDNALIDVRHMAKIGRIDPASLAEREARVLADHAAAVAALEAAA